MAPKGERSFAMVPLWVIETDLSSAERHVYEALALHARTARTARPSVARLAEITGRVPRDVKRALRGLRDVDASP